MSATSVLIDIIGRDRASAAFASSAASAERAARRMDGASATMVRVGSKLTKAVTVPALAIGAASIKTAVDFQKSMTLLQTAGGETSRKMKVISSGITKVATDTGASLKDLGEGMYVVAKAGAQKWSAVDQLKVLKAAAQGAAAENVPLSTSVDALTTLMQGYGMKAGDAVKAQNMLVRGSGLAKTTMQDFAGSLANVVPLAASLKVSFPQVAGAIATMTQHGETADRATQNLSNLLTALAGQNNVASGAMNQLGINTVNLQKNLGKRGLTGTLDVVLGKMEKHSHAGMIVVSAFKNSALATKSLNTELGTMNGELAKNSKGLLDGKVGIKDYTTFAKSLGGQAGASALQFLGLFKSSKGFSDQLKSGNGTVRTAASTLQKMFGGVTGMRTALMLTGTSAAGFKKNVDEVAKSSQNAGKNINGWSKTSQTAAVKFAKMREQVQVLGLNIGNALLPFVLKLAGGFSKLIGWITHLSGTQKTVLMWSVGLLAALGPILSITGRLGTVARGIGTFAGTVGTRLSGLVGASEATAARVGTAMRGVASAFMGVGIGLAVGNLTKNGSTATKVIGALGSAAAGAAMGFAAGGPVGAAIGGIAAGITSLVASWGGESKAATRAKVAAQKSLAAQKDAAQNLLTMLEQVNGAYGKQTRMATAQQLQKTGAFDAAAKFRINPQDVVSSAMGDDKANSRVYGQISAQINKAIAQGKKTGNYGQADALIAAEKKLQGVLNNTILGNRRAEKSYQQLMSATGNSVVPASKLAHGYKGLSSELVGTNRNLVLNASSSRHLTLEDVRNTEVVKENARQLGKTALAHFKAGASAEKSATQFEANKRALEAQLVALGFSAPAVKKLVDAEAKLPKSIKQKLDADSNPAKSQIDKLQHKIDSIQQNKKTGLSADPHDAERQIATLQAKIDSLKQQYKPTVDVSTETAMAKLNALLAKIPSGTFSFNVVANYQNAPGTETGKKIGAGPHAKGTKALGDGYFTVGESSNPYSWELGLKRGPHVELWSNADSRKKTGWNNVPGFASGTSHKVDTAKVGTAIGNVGSASTKQIDVASVGIDRVMAQIKHATKVLDEQIHNGLKASSAKSFRKEIAALTREAKAQFHALKVKIGGADTSSLTKALKGSVDDARTAFQQMITDVRAAGGNTKPISAAESAILAKMGARDKIAARLGSAPTSPTAYDRLATVKQSYSDQQSSIAQSVQGSFDITSAGQVFNDRPASGSSILASLTTAVAKAKTFASVLQRLAKAGLAKTLLVQLAQAGPAALSQAQALLSSGKSTISAIDSQYAQLTKASQATGKFIADQTYGTGVKTAQGLVNGLLSQESSINKAITKIADGMLKTLDKKLGIKKAPKHSSTTHKPSHSGGRHGAADAAAGYKKAREAAAKKHPKSHPTGLAGASGRGVHIEKVEIHEQSDPVATWNAFNRRLSALGAA